MKNNHLYKIITGIRVKPIKTPINITFRKYEKCKVSIIMPAYNAMEYLEQAIKSVEKQTYCNWELIIVNDCSTDFTSEHIKQKMYNDSRIIGIDLSTNVGVAEARNVGLKKAKGQYIAFLDSDDCWKPNKLERHLDFMHKNKVGFSYSNYCFMDESGHAIEHKQVVAPTIMKSNDVLKNTGIGCLTVVIDKSIVGEFDIPLLKHGEDTFAWYSILKKGFVAKNVMEDLAFYRETKSSLTSNKISVAKMQWTNYRNHMSFSLLKSVWYFCNYTLNAVKKHWR